MINEKELSYDEVTRHGLQVIGLLKDYSIRSNLSTYNMIVVFVKVMQLFKEVAEREMRKHDS